MRLHKFSDCDAFVAIDLEGAEASSGPARWARRILQGGAKDLARSQTYTYAALNMRRGGASAGISAPGPERADAIAAFVTEAASLVADGVYLPDPAKGVSEGDLAALGEHDPRNSARLGSFGAACDALTAACAAEAAVGGLDGRKVIIEGFNAPGATDGAALARAVTERGGRLVAVSDASATLVAGDSGLDAEALAQACVEHGSGALAALGSDLGLEAQPSDAVWRQPAGVVFAGSKMGAVNHLGAEAICETGECVALVPCGRLAFTAKALAVFRRNDVAAIADFVALCGATIAAWSDPGTDDQAVQSEAVAAVTTLADEFRGHPEGPFLGACRQAEAFLASWHNELPFGRPLAP